MQLIFIKQDKALNTEFSYHSPAILFRKKFILNKFSSAKLYVCGLGYGYYFINGKKVSGDMFTAPVSDYNKTLWYNNYDVSGLLTNGENIICAICGNGFYNENFESAWSHNKASWRDNPKLALELHSDDLLYFI